MKPYPKFNGECWSYTDAIRRAPSAWRIDVIRGTFVDGTTWQREERTRVCAPGLGHFEHDGERWIYVEPSGYARPVMENYDKPNPPALPRQQSEWRHCGCGKQHVCSACGQPYWIEIHGMADGECTYCYHAG